MSVENKDNVEAHSGLYQIALDLETRALMGITPDQKYTREVGTVFDPDKGALGTHVQPGAKVLDIACGRGNTSALIAARGYEVTGADISPTAVDSASKTFQGSGVKYVVADMKNPPAIEGGYDAITCLGRSLAYFEQYNEYVEALSNWAKALRDDGRIAIEWTEWSDGVPGNPLHYPTTDTEVLDTKDATIIREKNTKQGLKFPKGGQNIAEEYLDCPGPDVKVVKRRGGRNFINSDGSETTLGDENTLFVDLLKQKHFPVLKEMLEKAGFTEIRMVKDQTSLTRENAGKKCEVFAITAKKAPLGKNPQGVIDRTEEKVLGVF